MSSFSGRIKEYEQISVDRFDGDNANSTLLFLSHVHSDHTVGLQSVLSRIKAGEASLYASELTQKLLRNSGVYSELAEYICCLPLDTPTLLRCVPQRNSTSSNGAMSMTLNSDESLNVSSNSEARPTCDGDAKDEFVTVTLLAAGHCLGSCMLLFEGANGTVLYTGDFRIPIGGARRIRALHDASGKRKKLQTVYVDSTYCIPELNNPGGTEASEQGQENAKQTWQDIPSREEATQKIVAECERWLARGENHVVRLKTRSRYSYEHLFEALHSQLHMRVHVHAAKYAQYAGLKRVQQMLTLDPNETRIHDCQDYTKGAIFGRTLLCCDADVAKSFREQKHASEGRNPEESDGPNGLVWLPYESSRDAALERHALPCTYRPTNVCTCSKHRSEAATNCDVRLQVLTIIPSSLWFYLEARCRTYFERVDAYTMRVLYSMHASYGELRDFLGYLRPRNVVACVIPHGLSVDSVTCTLLQLAHADQADCATGSSDKEEDCAEKAASVANVKRQLFQAALAQASSTVTSSSRTSRRTYKRLRRNSDAIETFSDLDL